MSGRMPIALITKVFYYISVLSPILGIGIGLSYFFKNKISFIDKLIVVLLLFSFLMDFSGYISAKVWRNNLWVSNVYHLGLLAIIPIYFKMSCGVRKGIIHTYQILSLTVFTFLLLNDGVSAHQSLYYSVNNVFYLILTLFVFYEMFIKEDILFIEKSALFWYNTGFLIYFSGGLFSYLMGDEILSSSLSWVFHNISNIIKNVFLAIGLYVIHIKK